MWNNYIQKINLSELVEWKQQFPEYSVLCPLNRLIVYYTYLEIFSGLMSWSVVATLCSIAVCVQHLQQWSQWLSDEQWHSQQFTVHQTAGETIHEDVVCRWQQNIENEQIQPSIMVSKLGKKIFLWKAFLWYSSKMLCALITPCIHIHTYIYIYIYIYMCVRACVCVLERERRYKYTKC